MVRRNETQQMDPASPAALAHRRSWWNWVLMAGVLVVTTVAFAALDSWVIAGQPSSPWPWLNTDVVLVLSYALIVLMFVVYMTRQQRNVVKLGLQIADLTRANEEYKRRQAARLYALFDVSRVMAAEPDLQNVFECITQACVKTFDSHQASLMLLDDDAQSLHVRSAHGHINIDEVRQASQPVGVGVAGWVAKHRVPLLLGGPAGMDLPEGVEISRKHVRSAMVVPIILRDELVGVLNVSSRSEDNEYDREDLRALEVFAANAGACIRHTEQAEWMRRTIYKLRDKNLEDTQIRDVLNSRLNPVAES